MKGTIRVLPLAVSQRYLVMRRQCVLVKCTCGGSDVAVVSEATGSPPDCLSLLLPQPGCWQARSACPPPPGLTEAFGESYLTWSRFLAL